MNVHFCTGEICLNILKKEWSPAWGLQAACRAVLTLLSDLDADSPLNCDAGNMVQGGDKVAFYGTARMYTLENALVLKWLGCRRHVLGGKASHDLVIWNRLTYSFKRNNGEIGNRYDSKSP